jgi:hypothetical protein
VGVGELGRGDVEDADEADVCVGVPLRSPAADAAPSFLPQ